MTVALFPDRRTSSKVENARTVLEARYLRKDDAGRVIETPDEMFHRVAHEVARADIPTTEPKPRRGRQGFSSS